VRRHHNCRPEILVSALPPSSVSFVDGQHRACGNWQPAQTRTGRCRECGKPFTGDQPMVLCPDPGCCAWVYVQRGVLKPHHITYPTRCTDGDQRTRKIRCPGSGQRIRIDLTQNEHLALLYKVRQAADGRRSARVHLVPTPPVPPPVCRIGQAAA
jgi:hypothetical protein